MLAFLFAHALQPPPIYSGPIATALNGLVATIPLEESGLIIEVADSIVARGAGLGLFVRCAGKAVTLDGLSPFCGYAHGSMRESADAACGKSVTFALHSLDTNVFLEGQLWTVGALLDSGITIEGYHATSDAQTGALTGLTVDANHGARHFVPDSPQPELSILNVGQMANDLAIGRPQIGDGSSGYAESSRGANLLGLVQRLERDPTTPSLVRPSRPISAVARTITIANTLPMEVGCEYGASYWGMDAAAESK